MKVTTVIITTFGLIVSLVHSEAAPNPFKTVGNPEFKVRSEVKIKPE